MLECIRWIGIWTYVVHVPAEVEQDGFSQFTPVDTVVLAQLVIGEGSRVDVHEHLLVI